MNAEAPKATVNRFSQNWDRVNQQSRIAEFISISRETNREPDNYHFLIKDGLLLDPNTGRSVLDFITEGVEKDVARDLQRWATETEEGMSLWISPFLEKTYPCPKLVIHQIAYNWKGEKVVLNSAILFDGEIVNPEYKRQKLYTFPDSDENLQKILNWIKRKSEKNILNTPSPETNKQAIYFESLLQKGYTKQFVIQEMVKSGFIGQNPISCPKRFSGSFSELVVGNSRIVNFSEGSKRILCCTCPFCNKKVEAEIYAGKIHCPKCGKSADWKN